MIYVGVSFSKYCDSKKLLTETGYKTSSKLVHELIQEDGLSSFIIDKIKHFEDVDLLLEVEQRYLAYHYSMLGRDAFKKIFLNRNFSKCFIKSDEANRIQSELMIKNNPMFLDKSKIKIQDHKLEYWSKEYNRKIASDRTKEFFRVESNRLKHIDVVKNQWTEERKAKYSKNNPSKRQDVKDKVREKRLGMSWWNNGSIRTMSKTQPGPEWVIGYKIGESNDSKIN